MKSITFTNKLVYERSQRELLKQSKSRCDPTDEPKANSEAAYSLEAGEDSVFIRGWGGLGKRNFRSHC